MRKLVVMLVMLVSGAVRAEVDPPETVVVTYSPAAGKEAEVSKLIARHWATLVRLRLVTRDAHVTYRDKDAGGKPIFVDLLTWKSHAAPDSAPPEVEKIWSAMEAAVEKRGERRGIEFHEVERLK